MEVIKKDDSITLAKYADEKGLTDQVKWKWAKSYTRSRKVLLRRNCNILKAKKKRRSYRIKYQFGVGAPRNIKEAYELDRHNRNNLWILTIE